MRLFLAATLVAFTLWQSPSPTPAKAVNKPHNPAASKQGKASNNQHSASPSVSVSTQAITLGAQPETGKEAAQPKQKASTDWWLTVFTGALVLVAVMQFIAMHRQANYMRDNLAIAKSTADAALLNAQAAVNAVRPWISVDIRFTNPNYFIVTAKNSGNSPAEVWIAEGEFRFVKEESALPDIPGYTADNYVLAHKPLLLPGEHFETYGIPMDDIRQGAPQLMQEVSAFTKEFYIMGQIKYGLPGDKKVSWHSRWCFKLIPFKQLGMVRGGKPGYNEYT